MAVTVNRIEWIHNGGIKYKQERWEITRDDGLKLGTIYPTDYHPIKQPKARFSAMINDSYKSRYFTSFDAAVKWLEREHKNIYPISRLAEMLNKGY